MSDLRKGYNEGFLGKGFELPLPGASLDIQDDVLQSEVLRENYIADYIHYSVVMSVYNRQALFSAANLDQKKIKKASGRDWFVDPRIGIANQIGPAAYKDNPWDKGHLTRRTAVTWGSSYESKCASNDSCSYANACLQHMNFNQDEWRVPEEVVRLFDKDKNGKLSVFTGPVFTQFDRWYTNRRLKEAVRIPSGFWKVVAYIGKKTGKLECQAYLMYQDDKFIADHDGASKIEISNYQVTITEIEKLTGLDFPEPLFNSNPLYYYPRKGINDGPEGFKTPGSTDPADLKKGVVFTRKDAESKHFKSRSRNFTKDVFESRVMAARDV